MKPFSERQTQLIDLASQGFTDKEISIQAGISLGTIRTYWDRLRTQYDCKSRSELVAKALIHQATESFKLDLVDALPLFIWSADSSGNLLFRNKWFDRCSVSWPEWPSLWIEQAELDSEGLLVADDWRRAFAELRPFEATLFLQFSGELRRRHKIRLTPTLDPVGGVAQWIGYCRELADDADAQMIAFLSRVMA